MKISLSILALTACLTLPLLAAEKAKAKALAPKALPTAAALSADEKAYPAVTAAIKATEHAIAALSKVKADLGKHQAAAEKSLTTALTELKAGLEEAKASKKK